MKPPADIKPKQAKRYEILNLLKNYQYLYKTNPLPEIIRILLGYKPTSNIHYHLHKLEEEGLIRMPEGKIANIEIVNGA